MASLYSIVYVSTAVTPFSTQDLSGLLVASRERNLQAGITGMLLYKDGAFMQAFEGEREPVRDLHERIERDPRHHKIVLLLEGPCRERAFPAWCMGFCSLDDPSVHSQAGFSDLQNLPFHDARFTSEPSLAIRLLQSFRDQAV